MIETTKDKVKDYIIAILLVIIAVLIGLLFSKELMDKNISDRNNTLTTTRKQITNYFENLEKDGYVLNDFSTVSNFDYNLGKVNLFGKNYELTITNNHTECNPDCVYMYKIGTKDNNFYQSIYLSGIKTGVIGNYIAIQEIYPNGLNQLILVRANDGYTVQSYYFFGGLNIAHDNGVYTLTFKETNCATSKLDLTTITYNKANDTFVKANQETNDGFDTSICSR